MKDSEVIIQLREENERQKLLIATHRRKVSSLNIAFLAACLLAFIGMGAAHWQRKRDARALQCSACPAPTCPVCAPVLNSCKEAVMEMKGIYDGSAVILSCPHPDQRIEPTNYGWITCRCPLPQPKP